MKGNQFPAFVLTQAWSRAVDVPRSHLPHTLWISFPQIHVYSTFHFIHIYVWLLYRKKSCPILTPIPTGTGYKVRKHMFCDFVACAHGDRGEARGYCLPPQLQNRSLCGSGSKHIPGSPWPPTPVLQRHTSTSAVFAGSPLPMLAMPLVPDFLLPGSVESARSLMSTSKCQLGPVLPCCHLASGMPEEGNKEPSYRHLARKEEEYEAIAGASLKA